MPFALLEAKKNLGPLRRGLVSLPRNAGPRTADTLKTCDRAQASALGVSRTAYTKVWQAKAGTRERRASQCRQACRWIGRKLQQTFLKLNRTTHESTKRDRGMDPGTGAAKSGSGATTGRGRKVQTDRDNHQDLLFAPRSEEQLPLLTPGKTPTRGESRDRPDAHSWITAACHDFKDASLYFFQWRTVVVPNREYTYQKRELRRQTADRSASGVPRGLGPDPAGMTARCAARSLSISLSSKCRFCRRWRAQGETRWMR